jgi:hypothetical protein
MTILQMCEDLLVMKKMLKGVKKGKLINEENADTIRHIKETITSIQRGLRNSISKGGYNNVQENILERYLDKDGRHVYNTTSETNLEEDEHSLWSKGVGVVKRLNPFASSETQTADVPPVVQPIVDNNSLLPIMGYGGILLDFPVHLDKTDPFYNQRLRSWMIQHVRARDYDGFLGNSELYRTATEKRHLEHGINIQDVKAKIRYDAEQLRILRRKEREQAREKFRNRNIGETMDNTEDTTREHFQTRLVSAMLELFKDRANLKMEIDPNDPEHPNNEDPGKYASAMGEVAKLSSLLSFLAMRTKNDEAFGVLTELSERIHDMEPEAMVMVYKMAHAMDKSAQASPTKTEESEIVSIEESIINTLTSVIR